MSIKIIGIGSSTRTGSFSEKALNHAVSELNKMGVEATAFDFRANPLPLYNGDDEEQNGYTPEVLALKKAIAEADGVIISSSEYNASFTPLLKNAIDWASRGMHGEKNVWDGKPVLLMGTSPGMLGGIRGLIGLRPVFGNVGSLTLPDQVAIGDASNAFNAEGDLTNERSISVLKAGLERLVSISQKLK